LHDRNEDEGSRDGVLGRELVLASPGQNGLAIAPKMDGDAALPRGSNAKKASSDRQQFREVLELIVNMTSERIENEREATEPATITETDDSWGFDLAREGIIGFDFVRMLPSNSRR